MNGKFVKFNESGYKADLKRSIKGVLDTVSMDVHRAVLNNLAQLKVRKIDAKYLSTFPHALRMTNKSTSSRFATHFGMSNNGQNQSFRALYYEYGTGARMNPPKGWSPDGDDWNAVRPRQKGAPIYYRDRPWTDLGGNFHKRGGAPRGVRKLIPQKNILGHPISAQFWFRRALMEGTRNLDSLILQAVKSVPVTAYIKLRDIRVRM